MWSGRLRLRNTSEHCARRQTPQSALVGLGAVTRPDVRGAFVRGCRRVLLCERRSELEALCKGFTFDGHMELSLQVSDGRRRGLKATL